MPMVSECLLHPLAPDLLLHALFPHKLCPLLEGEAVEYWNN
jgi:hypothetical protein